MSLCVCVCNQCCAKEVKEGTESMAMTFRAQKLDKKVFHLLFSVLSGSSVRCSPTVSVVVSHNMVFRSLLTDCICSSIGQHGLPFVAHRLYL